MDKRSVKGVFIGKANVGKSSIIYRYINKQFAENIKSTIGASFAQISMKDFKFDIWDTAGQEKYESLGPIYYRNSDYVFMVFDVTRRETIHYCKTKLEQLTKEVPNATFVLLGNKMDLMNENYQDNVFFANKICEKYNIKMIYVSAKKGTNINNIFSEVVYIPKRTLKSINIEVDNNKNCCIIS